ncbi:4Fe-4S ferredoxin iron-sulfur binding domain protein [Methanocaldococcus bathoardescens]|uniref:4Fe-4S ferredoxin iron-sulfur binding domain protein n=1 Tax=Methanocaldococcus bathoardescens TaxID=1301915 RepID=A0A076LAH0_9EURY|nr:ferredoxin family protein [Methanocaldococcus bathoardescens]AIJ05370.1 4Fe-4S ferredoxin iron-sulfur binding domain protein [Methanocaldococcus bathoardescens]
MLSKILSIFKGNSKKDTKKDIRKKLDKIIEIDYNKCKNCLSCYRACKNNVFDIENSRIVVKNEKNCTKCGDCVKACRYGAIILYND